MAEEPALFAHAARRNNPHRVSADQIGAIPSSMLPSLQPNIVSVTAIANLNPNDPTTITGDLADSGNSAHLGKVIGLSENQTNIGFSAKIITDGLVQNSGWSWTAGSPIFLNGTILSQTPPSSGFIQQMGIAEASDTILVDVSFPILL
jgi:hypothetical protein